MKSEIIVTIICSVLGSTAISTLVTFFVNRNDVRKETDLCLLRTAILQIWLAHKDEKVITTWELESASHMAEQYEKLGGNSFVANCMAEMRSYKKI